MEYTPNHHLPQWVKSDRIMMDDFNQMCRDMEAGLDKAKTNSDTSVGTLRSDMDVRLGIAQSDRDRLYAVVGDITRDAYRQAVQQEFLHSTTTLSDSFWFNGLRRPRDGLYTGTSICGIRLCSAVISAEEIESAIQASAAIDTRTNIAKNIRTAFFTFISSGSGLITSMRLLSMKVNNSDEINSTVRLLLEETGQLLVESPPFIGESRSMFTSYYVPMQFLLATGVKYRIEFTVPYNSTFNGQACFAITDDIHPTMTIEPPPSSLSIVKSVTPPSWARSATGIMHWAGSGSVSLSVNGARLPVVRTGQSTNAAGAVCQEVEYRLDTLPGGPLTVTADMQRGSGELDLYDYGLLWK